MEEGKLIMSFADFLKNAELDLEKFFGIVTDVTTGIKAANELTQEEVTHLNTTISGIRDAVTAAKTAAGSVVEEGKELG